VNNRAKRRNRLRVFKNILLRRMFGPNREEVGEGVLEQTA
jgi:hypothetical protein